MSFRGSGCRFAQHPFLKLTLGVVTVKKFPQGQEGALEVFHPRFHDPLLLRVMGRARINPETVALGILAIGALDLRIVDAGLGDGALGVIDDDPLGQPPKPVESVAMAGQPGHHLGVLMPRPA